MKLGKVKLNDEKRSSELNEIAKEVEQLLDLEMAEAEGGCWTCDSYCKKCVSGNN